MRLQVSEEDPGVRAESAKVHGAQGHHGVKVRVGLKDLVELLLVLLHRVEGDALRRHGEAEEKAGVLAGQETHRSKDKNVRRRSRQEQRARQRGKPMPEYEAEAVVVGAEQGLEAALKQVEQRAVIFRRPVAQEAAAQHRGERERNEAGDEDRNRDGHGKLVQQPAEHAAHEQHGDEHRGERQRHGENGEADLPRSVEGRLERALAHFEVAYDVFQHHNGVVHDKADRKRERHQRQVVHRVTEQVHDGEGADNRKRQRETRDDRGRKVAQKEKDDHHHQRDGEIKRELDVAYRASDGQGPVVDRVQVDGSRHLPPERREQSIHIIDHLDRIGARLFLHSDHHGSDRRLGRDVPVDDLVGLRAVHDVGQLLQVYR